MPQESDPIELWSALVRISAKVSASISLAPVTVVVNGKGGSGASFVCANLGHALQTEEEKVLLLDASRHYGSLADYLNIREKQGGLNEALQRAGEMDAMALAGMVSKARVGMDVMPASVLPLRMMKISLAPVSARNCYILRGDNISGWWLICHAGPRPGTCRCWKAPSRWWWSCSKA
ncbi:hypothetical protein MBH78_19940 [Oceanimonas sp. NS1]|nr:hypothetical protein [Oceanimonas sp. NS1]